MYATLDNKGETILEIMEMIGKYGLNSEIQEELVTSYKHYNFTNYTISVVQGIELQGSTFSAYSDPRKRGVAAAYG